MNVYLLYKDREWAGIKKYYDAKSIVQDLGLKPCIQMPARMWYLKTVR